LRAVDFRRAGAFRAVDFRAVDLRAVDLRAVDFRAVVFLAVDFLRAGAFLAVDFLAVDFFRAVAMCHPLSACQDAMRFRRRRSRSLMPPHTPYRSSRRSA